MHDDDEDRPSPIPGFLAGLAGVGAIAAMRPSAPNRGGDELPVAPGRKLWVWPVPMMGGYPPAISDGFNSMRTSSQGNTVKHAGVDLMFRRRDPRDQVALYPPRTKHGSAGYFMPDAVPVLAASDGTVWSAELTSRGYAVVLDHGAPWATFYQHLAALFVLPTQRGRSGQRVRAGDVIGHVGADPLDHEGLMHLHFELWYRGAHEAAIDPAPLMQTWVVPVAPAGPATFT